MPAGCLTTAHLNSIVRAPDNESLLLPVIEQSLQKARDEDIIDDPEPATVEKVRQRVYIDTP